MTNNALKLLRILPFLFWLAGCTSQPTTSRYYVLDKLDTAHAVPAQNAKRILLNRLILADYLRQDALVMQTSKHTIHFSSHHFWAQPLQASITQLLLKSAQKNDLLILKKAVHDDQQQHQKLNLHIDHFLPTSEAKVLLSGEYWLLSTKNKSTVNKRFHLTLPLKKDGYQGAVTQMHTLIDLLAKDIANNVAANDSNG